MVSVRASLLILVKYPREGRVKTRLAEAVGDRAATRLYRDFVELCLKRYQSLERINCTIYFDPPEEEESFVFWLGDSFGYLSQPHGDLGARLSYGIEAQLQRHSPVIAIGTDSPDLPLEYIERAIHQIQQNDVVIGPCDDGGYYLIGLSKTVPELFQGISWSTDCVFEQTVNRLKKHKLSYEILPSWFDVDREEDVRRLIKTRDPMVRKKIESWKSMLAADC